ncbi:MAG: molybdenum cofactor biosynthesis protein MoaE [Verrucomicrobiota bacterium]
MQQIIQFTHEPIVAPALDAPTREIGACVEFQGLVRASEEGKPIAGLYYEAHEPMARNLLARHFTELSATLECAGVVFIHRLGWVPAGEASLFLRILSAHRGSALAFCGEAIDRMKTDVPIWKTARINPS